MLFESYKYKFSYSEIDQDVKDLGFKAASAMRPATSAASGILRNNALAPRKALAFALKSDQSRHQIFFSK